MFMDGAPICSLSWNNLGNNGLIALCAASSSLSNLKELKLVIFLWFVLFVKAIVRMELDVTDKLLCYFAMALGNDGITHQTINYYYGKPCVKVMGGEGETI